MRGGWVSIAVFAFVSVAPVGKLQAQAQSGIVDLGVRLAVLQTLTVAFTAESNSSNGKTTAEKMGNVAQQMRFQRLLKSESLDQILAVYSPDALVILPDGGSLNTRDLRSWFTEALARFSVSRNTSRLDPSGIQIVGDHALATGFVVTELSDKTGQVSQFSVFSDFRVLLIKQDGDWRVLRQSFSAPNGSWRTGN